MSKWGPNKATSKSQLLGSLFTSQPYLTSNFLSINTFLPQDKPETFDLALFPRVPDHVSFFSGLNTSIKLVQSFFSYSSILFPWKVTISNELFSYSI